VIRALHRIGNLLRDRPRVDADPLDEVPRKEPVDQELGLFALLDGLSDTNTRPSPCPNRIPIDLVQLLQIASILEVVSTRIGEGERPPAVVLLRG
jgi:hypothetical protein